MNMLFFKLLWRIRIVIIDILIFLSHHHIIDNKEA